ncbi:hypothetical protein PF005_g24008 [Phytophthora fragariae]|uniref:Uncharacterized protein n=1 Tax=Phytophthora fragariae TaxID=53985 RepID=A0A6A3IEQ9_9STRA|nr:hypothetical protein PF003_g33734 [Phytophthora fragariae]KAE8926337.1 hypothetical protein PF009_g23468 [Phytophthora fragariae]KAE8978955.1 hypothetical protein PF011_g23037 [Phytophthora fragariae]KAE9063521.1 hypothetical protein PF010_g28960 [Phytophthora fragariae]KAE9078168.1 hypothetical protein PF007_g23966 [Phytophthora fragariae]
MNSSKWSGWAAAEAAEGSTRASAGAEVTPEATAVDEGAGGDPEDPERGVCAPRTDAEAADATVEVAVDEDVAGEAADDGARADGGKVDADSEPSGSDIDERGLLDREKIRK